MRFLLLVAALALGGAHYRHSGHAVLPDPKHTPGAADPSLTKERLCSKQFHTRDERSVTDEEKRNVFQAYGIRCVPLTARENDGDLGLRNLGYLGDLPGAQTLSAELEHISLRGIRDAVLLTDAGFPPILQLSNLTAGFASTSSIFPGIGVHVGELMTIYTVRPCCLLHKRRHSPKHIYALSHSLKVRRVYTFRITAKMIKNQAVLDRTAMQFIRKSVGSDAAVVLVKNTPISTRLQERLAPVPASGGFVDLYVVPKRLLERLAFTSPTAALGHDSNGNSKLPKCGEYEIDHLISIELGGAESEANLWPQPLDTPGVIGFRTKDVLEGRAHRAVCAGTITLKDAQEGIAGDWYDWGKRKGLIK